ncbi:transmembrane protein 128 [Paramisgurnus dabryanus]|uniref:transmembrane protein 128 n=1 Tax=Paramisgurnus dabryanus TaxID=90735 RepID=UPI003CCF71B9
MAEISEFVNVRRRFKTQEQQEDDDEPSVQTEESVKLYKTSRFNRHSVFWIVASLSLTYYVDFFSVVLNSSDIHSWWFAVGLVLLGLCLSLAAYCIVYLEWIKGMKNYEHEYPAIPAVTTAAFIAASCSFNVALWPIWSFFTPVILFTQFMGVIMMISLLG